MSKAERERKNKELQVLVSGYLIRSDITKKSLPVRGAKAPLICIPTIPPCYIMKADGTPFDVLSALNVPMLLLC